MPAEKIGVCMYCGMACKLTYILENGRPVRIRPLKSDPVSMGAPCVKGLTIHEVTGKGRIKRPLIRKSPWRPPREASWEEALRLLADWLVDADPGEVMVVASGKTSNEDAYSLVKLARGILGTPNIDNCCGRLCHAPTVYVLNDLLGIPASPGRFDDILGLDALLLAGTNPASNYPVMFNRIMRARRENGLRVVSVDATISETARYSDVALVVRPGSEIAVFNYIAREAIRRHRLTSGARDIPGFSEYARTVEPYTAELVAHITGVPRESLELAADILLDSREVGMANGMGLTQHINSVETLYALYDLAIILGARIVTGRGEINVQGAGDMGASPCTLPTGGLETYRELSRLWGVSVEPVRGLTLTEALLAESMDIYLLSGFNPAHSMPASDSVARKLENAFTVQMDSYYNETSEHATLILPTPLLPERDGTITSGERRVRSIGAPLPRPQGPRREWEIVAGLASLLGKERLAPWRETWDVTREIVRVVPAYRRVSVEHLKAGEDQWADKTVRWRRLRPPRFLGLDTWTTRRYPWILVSFRSSHHFLSNEATSKSNTLNKFPESPGLHMSREDAKCLGLRTGDTVKLCTRRKCIETKIVVSHRVPPGILGMYWHFPENKYNELVPPRLSPITLTPQYKGVPARLEKAGQTLTPCKQGEPSPRPHPQDNRHPGPS